MVSEKGVNLRVHLHHHSRLNMQLPINSSNGLHTHRHTKIDLSVQLDASLLASHDFLMMHLSPQLLVYISTCSQMHLFHCTKTN